MKLPTQSIRKLFRECFSGESPIKLNLKKRAEIVKQWKNKLSSIEGIRLTNHPGDRDSRSRTLCRFTIPDPHTVDQYWRSDELRLDYDDAHQLILTVGNWRHKEINALVSSIEEIEDLTRQTLQRYAKRHAGDKKREKVRDFKSKAIIAQIEKMAAEQKFDYATTSDSKKIKLFVRMSKMDVVEIQIPFNRFEKFLPQLKNTVATMRELYHNGLRFKVGTVHRLPHSTTWTQHSDERN